MLIPCPLCGLRDLREFTVKGSAAHARRPDSATWSEEWHEHLHLRANPAGASDELWWHGGGCGAWLVVTRDTVTHAVAGARLASEETA